MRAGKSTLLKVLAGEEDVIAKKFAEAVKKAKETPLTEKPLMDFDLD